MVKEQTVREIFGEYREDVLLALEREAKFNNTSANILLDLPLSTIAFLSITPRGSVDLPLGLGSYGMEQFHAGFQTILESLEHLDPTIKAVVMLELPEILGWTPVPNAA